ncbi:MAG: glycosyltransferase family 2 protein [Ignavibacteria bacterium]|nr:glycosyltransferase family 2 protein [Ignavibacteria bacterium]
MPTLSVCTLVKNEEFYLPRMLASVKGIANEIIVLDTGSTDRTIEVAKECGARVESEPWVDDFSVMRNKLLSYATGDWVLMLDADEEITPENAVKIQKAMQRPDKAFACSIMNIFPYKLITSIVPLISTRLFRRERPYMYSERIHESINHSLWKLTLLPSQSDIEINHYGFTDEKPVRRLRNRRIFELELKNNPTETWVRTHLALALFLEKDYVKSENFFDFILSSQSKDLPHEARSIIMTLQAEIYRLQLKPVQAKMQAQRAVRLLNTNSLAEYIMANYILKL